MELKQIKELMSAMERTGTKRVSLKKDDFEIVLEREEASTRKVYQVLPAEEIDENPMRTELEQHRSIASPARIHEKATIAKKESDIEPSTSGTFVTSPMVGTFYLSPSPEDPAFVKIGDRVEKDTVVCIIEAMKVMNEVKAGVSGVIAEILIENGHPVEFSSKLFRISTTESNA